MSLNEPDEEFVAARIEAALAHISTENEAARSELRSALAEVDPERAVEHGR